jgi:hypothetical protein
LVDRSNGEGGLGTPGGVGAPPTLVVNFEPLKEK